MDVNDDISPNGLEATEEERITIFFFARVGQAL
jgi:hypothetical protein